MDELLFDNKSPKKILLEKKHTRIYAHLDIGLFYLPSNKSFVTWLINIQNDSTVDGHYFMDIRDAIKDFDTRW